MHFLQKKKNCVSLLTYPIGKGVTMYIFLQKNCMSLLAYFVERASLCAVLQKNACPRWPTLLRRASLHAFCAKKLCVLVDLPYWKVRHDVHFSKKVCMSLLVYPVEKGVTTCILLCKQNSCPRWFLHAVICDENGL